MLPLRRFAGALAATVALTWAAGRSSSAQGAAPDYARAAALRQAVQGKVTADRLTVRWLSGAKALVQVNRPGGAEWWSVDLRTGRKQPAGAEELAAAPAPSLPAYAPGSVLRSESGGAETEVRFENRTTAAVRLFWLDDAGERREYGVIAAGETRAQHTFAGHAWLVTREDGAPLAAFVAAPGGGRAAIEGPGRAQRPRRRGGGNPAAARPGGVSPDGKWTAFIRDHNLWLRPAAGGEERRLTHDGTADLRLEGPLLWSPDSRRLAAFRTVPAEERKVTLVESSPLEQLQPRVRTLDYLKPGDRIARRLPCLFDAAGGREIPVPADLFPNPWSIDRLRWEPDSSRLTFLYNERGHQLLRVVSVDAASGQPTVLVEERSQTFIDYAHKTYLQFLRGKPELLWMSERDGWNHLYRYDSRTGRPLGQVSRGNWLVREVERLDEERGQVWFWAMGLRPGEDPYHRHLCRVNLDGSGFTDLTPGDGAHSVEPSPDGEHLVDTYSRVDLPPVTELRRASDGSLVTELARADARELLATGWSFPQRFSAKGRDDKTDIHGVIWRPTNFQPGRKYPVIENIYAGPQGSFVPKTFAPYHGQRYLAELGFIVVMIDGMGTNWRGKAFHDVCWKNLADAGFPDRKLWLRAAAEKHPEMDLTRVGIYGGSAGGQNALAGLLHHGDLYKVGASDCGCHDNRMDKIWWNELWMGWPVGPHYAENSNVTHAHKLTGKVLLTVGELDTNVDPASTMQVVNALVRADKDFELLIVPGAGHGAGESPYGVRRRADFFVRHLLGVEPRR